jgi:aspartyl-tRNA(Asn)/glutamyl-tRNA(Gln) amidotransferase subunit B
MRADVNISLEGGKRAEIKNINSIKGAYKALKFEMVRQKNLIKRGIEIKQETRAFLESQMITVPMRLKEEAEDYRYIPDPDLPPMLADIQKVESIREKMPEPAHIKTERFVKDYGIKKAHARVLTSEMELADSFEKVAKEIDPGFAALWMRDELKRVLYYNKLTYKDSGINADQIIDLLKMLHDQKITTKAGQRIIEKMPHNSKMPSQIAEELGLIGLVEDDAVLQAVHQAIEENPEAVSDYYEGKKKAMNFLIGQVMRLTRGKADPSKTNQLVEQELGKIGS